MDSLHIVGRVALAIAPIALPFTVFGVLERFFPAGQTKSARDWLFNVRLSLLYLGVPTLLGGFIAATVALSRRVSGGGLIDLDFDPHAGLLSACLAVIVSLLAFDFFYYWWHRAQHQWPALWAMHKLHHMDESLGVSTQMRCHWLEEIGRIPFIFIPMGFLFNLPIHGGAVAFALTAWTGFIHSNLRIGLGRFGAVFGGPQVHRIHHSRLARHHDRNFAAMFPIFDVIFGTYYHPARDEYPPTGVEEEPEVRTMWQAVVLPFAKRPAPLPVGQA
jgi:sterol desaturase/sphingolipid hydroxylase (fatty acid hydroxylase superfamily)